MAQLVNILRSQQRGRVGKTPVWAILLDFVLDPFYKLRSYHVSKKSQAWRGVIHSLEIRPFHRVCYYCLWGFLAIRIPMFIISVSLSIFLLLSFVAFAETASIYYLPRLAVGKSRC
jgi:hypothetical protein